MRRITILLSLAFLSSSCANLRETLTYSAVIGGASGSLAGYALSPDKESRGGNAAIFGVVGAAVAAAVGYSLYEDDPRNQKLNHLLEKKELPENTLGLDLGELNIQAQLSQDEVFKTPTKELPSELRGKVKEQYIIKYQSKERYLNKGNKTYYIPSFQIFEHAYENLKGESDE